MIPLVPIAIVAAATALYLSDKRGGESGADEGADEAQGEQKKRGLSSLLSGLLQRDQGDSEELGRIQAELEEHRRILSELEGREEAHEEDDSIAAKIRQKAAARHSDLEQLKAELKKLSQVLEQHEKQLKREERSFF